MSQTRSDMIARLKKFLLTENAKVWTKLMDASVHVTSPKVNSVFATLKGKGLKATNVYATDGKLHMSLIEDAIIYNAYLHAVDIKNQCVKNAEIFKILCDLKSFESLQFRTAIMLIEMKKTTIYSDEYEKARLQLQEDNKSLSHIYWEAGYILAAVNLLTETNILMEKFKLKPEDETLPTQIDMTRKTALHHILCAMSLQESEMSKKIMHSVLIEGNLFDLIAKSPEVAQFEGVVGDKALAVLAKTIEQRMDIRDYISIYNKASDDIKEIKKFHSTIDSQMSASNQAAINIGMYSNSSSSSSASSAATSSEQKLQGTAPHSSSTPQTNSKG